MLLLLAIADIIHPLSHDRSSIGMIDMIGCYNTMKVSINNIRKAGPTLNSERDSYLEADPRPRTD